MTPEQAAALRAPFPPSAIGKLPKPYKADSPKGNCKDCGGYHGLPAVHLDYVGHAAVSDRLLTVDPEWSWEPLALDPNGLPALTSSGNLWIRLTVCGVTRIGVGDGKSHKEIIGDAIRNAAMRFGVALDLWSKEELEQAHGPAPLTPARRTPPAGITTPAPGAPTAANVSQPGDDSGQRTAAQSGALHAAFNGAGIKDKDAALAYCSLITGRRVESTQGLTKDEASRILDALHTDAQDTTEGGA